MGIGRIYFRGNPWPEGHEIAVFKWTAERRGNDAWFHFHLETEKYYAERDIEHDDSIEYLSDWLAPSAWGNFHSCTISTNEWHPGGFRACSIDQYSARTLDGLTLHVDPLPCDLHDHDSRAFHIYLLGHDTVVDHQIKFMRVSGTDLFDISWQGKIALTYVGEYAPVHAFEASIQGVRAPSLTTAAHVA
jgi:hypothetical protein